MQSKIDALPGNVRNKAVYYYYDQIRVFLTETMKDIEKEGEVYSMLPQDLMMRQIDSFFGPIPLPLS